MDRLSEWDLSCFYLFYFWQHSFLECDTKSMEKLEREVVITMPKLYGDRIVLRENIG